MIRFAVFIALASMLATASPSRAETTPQEEANRAVVLDFYDKALNQKDFAAAAVHFGPHYIQHNPKAPDGIEGFRKFIEFRRKTSPDARSEVKRVVAEGDMVVLHVHGTNGAGDPGSAIVDIFRLEDGKIVEHWDVIQAVPEASANGNTMF